jgi:integrase
MPKIAEEKSALAVKRLKAPGLHAVGGAPGLRLQVTAAGAKSWVLKFSLAGRRREMGLGGFAGVTLAEARQKAKAARDLLDRGVDPVAEREAARSAELAERTAQITFQKAFERFVVAHAPVWTNAKHRWQWEQTIVAHALPTLGPMLVKDILPRHVVAVIEPLWYERNETANRLRGRIEKILGWAKARGFMSNPENAARWKANLEHMLPSPSVVQTPEQQPSVQIDEMNACMTAIRAKAGMAWRCLELIALTAVRSGEARGARWSEFDLDGKSWNIPAERMKAKKPHRVILSDQAVTLLESLPRHEKLDIVFFKGDDFLHEQSLNVMFKRLGFLDKSGRVATPHGLRSTFKVWASERANFENIVSEMALAHAIESKVEAAYRRGDLAQKRAKLMAAWANFVDTPVAAKGNVVAIRKPAQRKVAA